MKGQKMRFNYIAKCTQCGNKTKEIKTKPEKIWEFFTNLEQNYKAWHPEDHALFRWTKGKPMEMGSKFYAEEYLNGKLRKFKGTIGEIIPNRKIVFKYSFPLSLASPGNEFQIEPKDSYSVFTAVGYVRCIRFYRLIAKKHVDTVIEIGKKHVKEEGENLKKILEKKNSYYI